MNTPMNQYQSVAGKSGSSQSQKKWEALCYTEFSGKSVLDLGCNEGFFIEKAIEHGATEAVGVDLDKALLSQASKRVPSAKFIYQDWEEFLDQCTENKFDVVIMLSALHYSKNYAQTLSKVAKVLKPDGIFILEASVHTFGESNHFVPVTRGHPPLTDTVFHFTPGKLLRVLERDFFVRYVGPSVEQPGDPIRRFIYNLFPKKPFCLLVTGRSGSGKTAITNLICKSGENFEPVFIDEITLSLMRNEFTEVGKFLKENFTIGRLDLTYEKLINSQYLTDFLSYVVREAEGFHNIVIEGFPLEDDRVMNEISKLIIEKGYIVKIVR